MEDSVSPNHYPTEPDTTEDSVDPNHCEHCDRTDEHEHCDDCGATAENCVGECWNCGEHCSPVTGECERCAYDDSDWDYCDGYCECDECWDARVEPDASAPAIHCDGCHAALRGDAALLLGKFTEAHYCQSCAATLGAEMGDAYPLPTTPLRFTFGVECEVGTNGARLLHALRVLGLTDCDTLHDYHCRCYQCDASHVAAQQDPTVDGEFVTRVLYSTDRADWAVLRGLVDAAAASGCAMRGNVGAHVNIGHGVDYNPAHVGFRPWTDADAVDRAHDCDERTAWRLYWLLVAFRDDWEALAGTVTGVRPYNGTADWLGSGPRDLAAFTAAVASADILTRSQWHAANVGFSIQDDWAPNRAPYCYNPAALTGGRHLVNKGNRWEFRAWNGTRAYWRSALSVAVSAAAVAWAESTAPVPHDWARVSLVDTLRPFLSGPDCEAARSQCDWAHTAH